MRKIFWLGYDLLSTLTIALALLILPLRIITKKFSRRQPLSLWTGTPIITMAFNARAESLMGVNAKSLVYRPYFITKDFDYNLSRWTSVPIIAGLVSLAVFLWACLSVDRLHFYCDRGLLFPRKPFSLDYRELFVYKLLKIPVFFWTYGADIRSRQTTKGLGDPNCCSECTLVGKACICDEAKRIHNLEKLKHYSKAIFSMGDMIEYTPGSRNDLFFWPIDLYGANADKYEPAYPQPDATKPIRIVHAPNHRMFKGTHFLIEAVKNLQAEGIPVELTLVEKVPNDEALNIYRSADLIFDQCLIGFHGYFALEGMAMGKPVMCFIRKPQEYLLHPEECPIINTQITNLEKDICTLVENRQQLRDIGISSRQYIEKYFTLEAFAERLKTAYEDLGVTV
ncbi:MAG: glycosyltransferase [Symploca sp. SIO2E6]|nr:glycosyltransferase [Symploca sp. SIO2E6]